MGPARRRPWSTLLVLAGCAGGSNGGGTPSDAPEGDACIAIWYADVDEDGHGDPNAPMPACTQPAKTVASSDDCDDKDRFRYPGASEVCDGADNDCDSASVETCPATCQPVKRPPPDTASTYLMCNSNSSWQNAKSACESVAGFHLIRIDDDGENAWLRAAATTAFGGNVNVWLAGTDLGIEGTWLWDGSVDQFWQGGPNGAAISGRYAKWGGGEPNNDGNEDCAAMRGDSAWYDGNCPDNQRFVCER